MKTIQSIIHDYFEFDFFWKQDSKKRPLIKNLARDFQAKHPNAIENIMQNLKAAHPELTVRRYTYFVEDDRCLTFEIISPNLGSIVGAISIFGYFLTWSSIPGKSGFDKYFFENQDAMLNDIFHTIVNPEFGNSLSWATKEMISEEVEAFNLNKILEPADDLPIYVANLLTRFH